jgi:thiol-disulfide isomerase/thioredoxin
MSIRPLCMCWALVLVAQTQLVADEPAKPAVDAAPYLTIRLLDEKGLPIAGAKAGLWIIASSHEGQKPDDWYFKDGEVSDAEGLVRLREGIEMFRLRPVVIARHAERHLMGVHSFPGGDVSGVVDVTLRPECRVRWSFACPQLLERGRQLARQNILASLDGKLCSFTIINNSGFETLLPPGKFQFECMGGGANRVVREIEIRPGDQLLDLGTAVLTAKKYILLEGQPAPEIEDVFEWKNGPPLKLADLRGKFVLLEFWGWWCGPCVQRGIPELFALRSEFDEKDLAIIGLHIPADDMDEIDSVAKLDAELASVRETTWKGKDIPFPVAMCRSAPGTGDVTEGDTHVSRMNFAYGIDAFPTSVLIDREGKVVGQFAPGNAEDRAKLRKLLEGK